MKKHPNILFLMTDQHRADLSGFAGNSIIRTPVLDKLATTGVVFNNAYTPSPLCVPARQCMMAGQLPKTCGCETWVDLKPGYRTFAREFSRYAYNTVCSGKLHHIGLDQMQGWRTRIAPDAMISENYVEDRVESEFTRYYRSPTEGRWSHKREIEEARPAEGPWQNFDRNAVTAGMEYLERYFKDSMYGKPKANQPLLFKLSLLQPHYPFFTDRERFDYYLNRVPVYNEKTCNHPVLSLSQQGGEPVKVSAEAIRRATAAYYGMIDRVDTYFGQVLDQLESFGENMDEWIILYTSDHGEMLGEHGLWEKTRFYEGSVRVPLFIRWPASFKGGRIVNENVNLCDIFATLCDLAGIETPENLDSRSLVSLLYGESSNWNNESISQLGDHVMIKRDHLKYQYYGKNVPEVLFDLERDPGETVNIATVPEFSEVMLQFRDSLAQYIHS